MEESDVTNRNDEKAPGRVNPEIMRSEGDDDPGKEIQKSATLHDPKGKRRAFSFTGNSDSINSFASADGGGGGFFRRGSGGGVGGGFKWNTIRYRCEESLRNVNEREKEEEDMMEEVFWDRARSKHSMRALGLLSTPSCDDESNGNMQQRIPITMNSHPEQEEDEDEIADSTATTVEEEDVGPLEMQKSGRRQGWMVGQSTSLQSSLQSSSTCSSMRSSMRSSVRSYLSKSEDDAVTVPTSSCGTSSIASGGPLTFMSSGAQTGFWGFASTHASRQSFKFVALCMCFKALIIGITALIGIMMVSHLQQTTPSDLAMVGAGPSNVLLLNDDILFASDDLPPPSHSLLSLLHFISGKDYIDDVDSASHMAMEWLMYEDSFRLTQNFTDMASQPDLTERIIQRFAIAAFHFSTGSASNFVNSDLHECDWEGTSCESDDDVFGGNVVTALGYSRKSLFGTIPHELHAMTHLEHLVLSHNSLSGTIPHWINKLSRLDVLFLNYNNLTGTIPMNLGGMVSLREVWLEGNSLSGSMPEELCVLNPFILTADCATGDDSTPKVRCDCCSGCFR